MRYSQRPLSLLKRLFSADYRAAVNAEAAGQLDQAAERYVLAGEHAEAARIHLARAARADSRNVEIAALRDALHWVGEDKATEKRIHRELGKALLARVRAEGVATQRDKEKVREAARMLMAGGDYLSAGDAFESIDDAQYAAQAYRHGGFVDRMEAVLGRDDERSSRERALRDSFANYEMHMRIGDRDRAVDALRHCVESAAQKGEYRRLLDELESRLIGGGLVALRRRGGVQVTVFAGDRAVLGRDPLCELTLRTGGISRRHAEIAIAGASRGGDGSRFSLADAGSKNGTLIAGMPIAGSVPLEGEGRFDLGEHCTLAYRVTGAPAHLRLCIERGMDRGHFLILGGPGETIALDDELDLPIAVELRRGRPLLTCTGSDVEVTLDRKDIAQGAIQLIHGDQLVIAGVEVEVV